MSDVLPWIFIIIAGAAMLVALGSLWLSLSLGLSDEALGDVSAQLTSDARRALLTEKDALLQELGDVAFEHDAGKLSDKDFEELNQKLRAQARHLLHELDEAAEAFRDEAEALIAKRLGEPEEDT
ncbi:MAG: hypothetical protein OEM15_12160 [Myxococcales bacterium]|nr:hypothetical protein [Myxococcales bacterium]MDH3485052.1 hypothetical protein [Myxococcales bacterium]